MTVTGGVIELEVLVSSKISLSSSPISRILLTCAQVERAWLVTATGGAIELEAGLEGAPPVAPTFAPVGQERAITTRAAASSVDRRQRTMQEVNSLTRLSEELT